MLLLLHQVCLGWTGADLCVSIITFALMLALRLQENRAHSVFE